ncbi:sulfate ABC transporter, ATPase subunit [Stanieria cyanosphaera PCC 7437]|uniref:ABC-type quaternary amine transporter n=1 Tax=Stanieria cyanosphaera (strain ATCC 29371 / PCC 7437) TaxID=111780 RepID=K9XRN8_STAC7|nr:TOBE-like domain-containing protein [Stanieria cyanosphaera]AFZ35183.1 sulfate ABC transporter, ATPase subunit [Stanieria cyanosphaera PCC 7437]
MSIFIEKVSKQFGDFQALKQIDLAVNSGKLVALLGPSGSGKSTLLRAIAGLEPPDTGKIFINEQDTTHLDIRQRNIGFVFQHYALFKHLTIWKNIAFGLTIRKYSPSAIKKRVEELLDLIQLQGFSDRYPSQLSGGQRQRVALARALAVEPQVLLLDEPFGALDAKVRKELRAWLRKFHEQVGVTTILVTHDREEAMEVADQIVVMNQGQIEQVGTAGEIYDRPASPFVMSFIGEVNVLPNHADFCQKLGLPNYDNKVFVRPHDIELLTSPDERVATGKLQRVVNLGYQIQAELMIDENLPVYVQLSRDKFSELALQTGQQVFIKLKETKSFVHS